MSTINLMILLCDSFVPFIYLCQPLQYNGHRSVISQVCSI